LIRLALLSAAIAGSHETFLVYVAATPVPQALDTPEQQFYTSGRPYLDEPFEQLVERIPELSALQPARSQQALPMILEKTGERVDEFFRDITNLVAHEEVTQERVDEKTHVQAREHLQYNYMIVLHRDETPPRFEEYRADVEGKPGAQKGATKGYSVTYGFTLKCMNFATRHLPDSRFRYLGDEMVGDRKTHVVAFAQQPGHATIAEMVSGSWGSVKVLVQGIAWIDEKSFQIVRLRTDLLAPPTEAGLERQTTEVTFNEVKLPDIETPMWLPGKVTVDAVFRGQVFRNEHRYTNYEHFRVSVKMKAP
jgi:hypothetical protein